MFLCVFRILHQITERIIFLFRIVVVVVEIYDVCVPNRAQALQNSPNAKKTKINPNQIFIDTSTTSSIPLTPSKKESKSIILTKKDGKNTIAKEIPISQIPLVYSMSKVMNILRVYTPASYRKKVEIATKSIQRELK